MASEIRSLDSDMQVRARAAFAPQKRAGGEAHGCTTPQMLVYENYSKFITATDTIRRMRGNVESMGGRVVELQVCVVLSTLHLGLSPRPCAVSPPSKPPRRLATA